MPADRSDAACTVAGVRKPQQKRSFDHIVRTAQEAYSGNPAFRRPSINSFEFLWIRAICADIV